MKTSNTTIKLLKEKEGYANLVETTGIYESSTIGKFEWGIFHNGIGARWYAIHKINKRKFIHVYDDAKKLEDYIISNIMAC